MRGLSFCLVISSCVCLAGIAAALEHLQATNTRSAELHEKGHLWAANGVTGR